VLAILQSANLLVRFGIELAALAGLGWWGWNTGNTQIMKLSLAAGLPLAAATLWAMFASPGSSNQVPNLVHVGTQILVLGSAAIVLYQMRHSLALSFSAVAIANAALMRVWHQ
jgi:hypothetical protein